MSGNSGSQGASGANAPVLAEFTVTWDHKAREWVARNRRGVELRGKNQRELELARNHWVVDLADDFAEIVRSSHPFGYPPAESP